MTASEISKFRIFNQKIEYPTLKNPKEIVSWMGAMQAQDFTMSEWAVGSRLMNSTEKNIETAYNKGEIIRTHLLRPTWHLVSPDDIYWMLDLTASKIKSAMKSRNKELELTPQVFKQSNEIIEKALFKNKQLTREELIIEFHKANIRTDENRLSHLLMEAEMDQLICSGPLKNKKISYSLLEERVPDKKRRTKEEALFELAKRYFCSHGPATLKDFVWWSGLSVTEAKNALESVKHLFISETYDLEEYWFTDLVSKQKSNTKTVYLLPAYDEFLIAYRDRSASIEHTHKITTISNNGIFRPILVINGKISGIWKRSIKKNQILIEIDTFVSLNKSKKNEIEKASQRFGYFMEKEINIKYK